MSIDSVVDDIILGKRKIDDVSLEEIPIKKYLFKTELDIWIDEYLHAKKNEEYIYIKKISDYILSGKEDLSKEFLFLFNENIKMLLDEFAKNLINSHIPEYRNFAIRNNGVNHKVSHFFEVARNVASKGASVEKIIVALNHDKPEDYCELKEIDKEIILRKKGYSDEEIENEKKLTRKEFNIHARKNIREISDHWKNCSEIDYKLVYEGIKRVTRFNLRNYQGDLGGLTRTPNKLERVYLALIPKSGGDRIHNTKTMRPIQKRQNQIIKKINLERGVSKEEYKARLFKFDEIKEAFYNGSDLTDYKRKQKENLEEHNYLKSKLEGEHSLDHFFNTTKHSFIIKNLYKNILLLNQANSFLKNVKNKDSEDYIIASEMKKELIQASFEEITYQLEHSLRNHLDLDRAGFIMRKAKEYKEKGGFKGLSDATNESFFDGAIRGYFNPLLDKKEGFYKFKDLEETLDLSGNMPENFDRFRLYVALYHMFEEFKENENFYYPELIEKYKSLPSQLIDRCIR